MCQALGFTGSPSSWGACSVEVGNPEIQTDRLKCVREFGTASKRWLGQGLGRQRELCLGWGGGCLPGGEVEACGRNEGMCLRNSQEASGAGTQSVEGGIESQEHGKLVTSSGKATLAAMSAVD